MLAQFFQSDWTEVTLVHRPDPFLLAGKLTSQHVVMHNASYDVSTIQAQLNSAWKPQVFDDTFLLAKLHYYSKEKFSLDAVMQYTLGYDPYLEQGLDKKILQKSKWTSLQLSKEQCAYAATDVYYLGNVYDEVKEQKEEYGYQLDILTLSHCLDFQLNGMPVDQDRLQKRYAENLTEIDRLAVPINVNSWQQVRPYIGAEQSDDLALQLLAINGNDKARDVRATRKLKKQNSFLDKFDTREGRIFGKFVPSTKSGRLASKAQNLQQIPRALKGVFGYTTEDDKVLIYSDYAQLELRCICAITAERRMEERFRNGEDLHEYTAEMLFGKEFTKTQRQVAKTANFGLLYGAGIKVFGQILLKLAGMQVSEAELTIVKKKWRNLWPAIAAWQDRGISAWRSGLTGVTPLGRRYTAKLLTDQLNIQNQGFGAEVAKLALHYILKDLDPRVKVLNFIHDSYILECPKEEEMYEEASKVLADCMQRAWFESIKGVKIPDLPMPVECFVGYNWGSIEDDYLYKYVKE
jgi:DNA polymerase I-like protein with 3'-5' exonuclease and polymerase domains